MDRKVLCDDRFVHGLDRGIWTITVFGGRATLSAWMLRIQDTGSMNGGNLEKGLDNLNGYNA